MICSPSLGSSSSSQLSFSYLQAFSGCPDTHRWLWNTPWVHIKGNSPVELNQQPTCPYSPWTLALHATVTHLEDPTTCARTLLSVDFSSAFNSVRTWTLISVTREHRTVILSDLDILGDVAITFITPPGVCSQTTLLHTYHTWPHSHSNSTLQFADDTTLVACTANNEQRADGDGGHRGAEEAVSGNLVSQSLKISSSEKTLAICGNTRTEIGTVGSEVVRRSVTFQASGAIWIYFN